MQSLNLRRISLFFLILFMGVVIIWQLSYFIPAFLLAITLYILCRKTFFRLVKDRGWKKWMAAAALILLTVLVIALPVWLIVEILIPKAKYLFANSSELLQKATVVVNQVKQKFPKVQISDAQIQQMIQKGIALAPGILGTTAGIITNLLTALFVVYFMFVGGEAMEKVISDYLPLKKSSKDSIWQETHKLIISNAIGIPVLAFLQGLIAIAGYWIFGVEEFIIWGMLTGVCSLLPVIGTMIVWIPIVIYLFAVGDTGQAIGLTLFAAIIISNIDNVLRFTLMRRIGDVHPLITVFGVIIGLQLFGIIGLIFGPLFLSYFILLIRIYKTEFQPEHLSEKEKRQAKEDV
jgi:predicted PurR-regulated permease PerM